MEKQNQTKYYEDSVQKLPIKELLKRIGPGMILTGIVIGPGAVTTAAMIGARFEYNLLWLFLGIAFMGVTFVLTANRISLLTGKPILHAIRHYYGGLASSFVGVALFIACMFFTIGNVSGTGAGVNLLFGLDWKIGALIMIAFLLFIYLSKDVYSKLERIVSILVLAMVAAFVITLFGTGGPDMGKAAKGITGFSFPEGSLATALGFISTNAAVTTGIYGTYLGLEKKWKKEDLFNRTIKADAIIHIITVIIISSSIMLVGAIVLFPQGLTIKTPQELGEMLVPVMGEAARYVMGIALLAAAYSSLLGNTQRTVVLLNAGLNKPTALSHPSIQRGSIIVLIIGVAIAFMYNGSPTQLILIANVCTSIATPVAGFFMCMLILNKDVNAGTKRPIALQISMIVSYLFVLVLTISALSKQIPSLISTFFG